MKATFCLRNGSIYQTSRRDISDDSNFHLFVGFLINPRFTWIRDLFGGNGNTILMLFGCVKCNVYEIIKAIVSSISQTMSLLYNVHFVLGLRKEVSGTAVTL